MPMATIGYGAGAPLRTGGFYGLYDRRGRSELKTIDIGTGAVNPVPTAGQITLLNGVAQGTDYTARIGRKIEMTSVLLRFWFLPITTSAPVGDACRVIVFHDAQTNAAAPIVTDVLNAADYLSPNNLNNRDRFTTLWDKTITMNPVVYAAAAPTTGNPVTKALKLYRKIRKEVIFGGTAATVGSITSGGIFLLLISAEAQMQLSVNSRIRFKDS